MVCRTEQEKYYEEEAETLQDSIMRKGNRKPYFKTMTFENIGRAKRLLKRLGKETTLMEELYSELKNKIEEYEEWVELDTLLSMEVE